MNTKLISALVLSFAILIASASYYFKVSNEVFGSTVVGNDYVATSTAASNVYGAWTTGRLVKNGYGSLDTIVITGANTGAFNVYNASTTDATKRLSATSTILIASFPANTPAGTYTFDAEFTAGLYVDLVQGNMPTTTISYR